MQRGRGIPLVGKIALSLAILALGAGVLYLAVGGLRTVAGGLGTQVGGFVKSVTATPTPAPTPLDIINSPLLTAPDEPYTSQGKVDLVVTVPADLVGSTDHQIRVYLALKDQSKAPLTDAPISATSAKTIIPIDLEKGINDISVTIVGPGGESDPSPVVRYVLDTAKPKVTVTSPKDGAKVNAKKVDIKGKVQGRSTLIAHNSDNNASITGTAEADGTFVLSLALTTGTNHILITATDPAGNVAEKQMTIRRGPGSSRYRSRRPITGSRASHCRSGCDSAAP